MSWIFTIILFIVILFIKKKEKEDKIVKDYTEQMKQKADGDTLTSYRGKYQPRQLLTKNEWNAYKKLKQIADSYNLIICPKVRLIDIVEPKVGNQENILRAKVIQKHIDFVICNSNLKILGVLELDDKSHDTKKRMERDFFVDEILTDVGYIVIRTRYINENVLDPIVKKYPRSCNQGKEYI